VWGLRRDPSRLPAGIEPVAADVGHPATLTRLPAGLDAVVHAVSARAFDDAAYRAAYVEGPAHLLAALAAQDQGIVRIVFVSSTGVYAQQDGEWVDETSETLPGEFSGRRLLQGERLVLAGPYRASVLRLGGIYGPGRARVIESVRAGRSAISAGPPRYGNRIHRDDAAAAVAHLVALDAAEPTYLGVDDDPADEADVLRWLAARLGVAEPPVLANPAPPAERRGNKRCRNARLVASGFACAYPTFREGYAALIDP
jgi:nucleoside-diphosphate-sugar epimerase